MKSFLIILILIIGFGFQSQSQTACLLANYTFTGNANDASGNGHHLSVSGATLTKDRNGNNNQAYHFNGSQYLYGTATPAFSNDEFSTSFWAKPEAGNTNNNRILAVSPPSSYWHYYCNVSVSSLYKFAFIGVDGSGNYNFNSYVSQAYTTNKWVHIVSTYKGDSIKMYVDGVLNFTSKIAAKVRKFTTDQILQIGASYYPSAPSAGYIGDLDDIRIYCKALDKSEVLQLYNGCNISVVSEPTDQTVNLGSDAKFKVTASDINATYKWQIYNGTSYIDLSNSGQYSGVNTNELTISNSSFSSNNNQKFRCNITKDNCSAISKEVLLKVKCISLISKEPISINISNGSQAKFNVSNSFTNSSNQWQIDQGVGFKNLSNSGQFDGVFKDTLKVSNVSLNNTNEKYRCLASYEGCYDTSNTAVLTVYCNPVVTKDPKDTSAFVGSSTFFAVSSNDSKSKYVWQSDLGFGYQNLTNAGQYYRTNSDTLIIKNLIMPNDNQNFRCIVKSGLCSDTSNSAVLTIKEKVGITKTRKPNFSIYPNPANSFIVIESDQSLMNSDFNIFDQQGRTIISGTVKAKETLVETKHLANGVYYFQMGAYRVKLIKQ